MAVRLLDCTLRDGGYINDWQFGERVIRQVHEKLYQANIDIIECGFLKSGATGGDSTVYGSVEQIKENTPYLKYKSQSRMYLAMMNIGEIADYRDIADFDEISDCGEDTVDGIRITFRYNQWELAELWFRELKRKGYKVFLQPVNTPSYSDEELLDLVRRVNALEPYAFYIVDTFGAVYENELSRMIHLIDHNMNPEIALGFHSHNNIQLSFSHAQYFLKLHINRELILDCSVFGMGRGGGNLCTELVTEYFNRNFLFNTPKYKTTPILEIIDECLMPIYNKTPWGYSAPQVVSAINHCHPNYALFLMNKQTIFVSDINKIIQMIPMEKRALFDRDYITALYEQYMDKKIDDTETLGILREKLDGKTVLLLAPGITIISEHEKIVDYIVKSTPVVVSINAIIADFKSDYIFFGNNKRYKLYSGASVHVIATSNIEVDGDAFLINYSDYFCQDTRILDNSGMMCVNLLSRLGVKNIVLAGFDGFDNANHYASDSLPTYAGRDELSQRNEAIKKHLDSLRKEMNIVFLTSSMYETDMP